MRKYIQHDAVAAGLFNRDFSSAHGAFAAWTSELENSSELLALLLERMLSDFERTHAKMRKPWTLKDLEARLLSETVFDYLRNICTESVVGSSLVGSNSSASSRRPSHKPSTLRSTKGALPIRPQWTDRVQVSGEVR